MAAAAQYPAVIRARFTRERGGWGERGAWGERGGAAVVGVDRARGWRRRSAMADFFLRWLLRFEKRAEEDEWARG